MEIFLQQLLNGLSIASVIALIAIGITLIFGLTGIVNFAQGEMLMIGGYTVWFVIAELGLGAGLHWYMLGLVLAVLVVGGLGLILERGIFRFTLDEPINGFIVSIGLIVFLQHFVGDMFSSDQQFIPRPLNTVWEVGEVRILATRVFVIAAAVLLLLVTFYAIHRTRWGRALRASAADRDAAELMGIPVRRYIMVIFFIGSAIAGFGGALLIALFPITPLVGGTFVIKAFAVAIIGGLGNVSGAALAALILGVLEALSQGYLIPEWTNAYAFGLMILMLLVRPHGLLRGTAAA
jgi:branched-chain amino acid transport system permease protein